MLASGSDTCAQYEQVNAALLAALRSEQSVYDRSKNAGERLRASQDFELRQRDYNLHVSTCQLCKNAGKIPEDIKK